MSEYFDPREPVYQASAPGRLDVMGGIADYSGSLVLQLPLDRRTTATLQRIDASRVDVVSRRADADHHATVGFDVLRSRERLAEHLAADPASHWASYVFGVAHACLFSPDARVPPPVGGFRMRVESTVPEGKGVSSSAALEVSSLAAIAAAYGVNMTPTEIAVAAQWAENHVAGAPCGIMDQMTSACGVANHLLRLRCQPAIIEGHIAIPPGYRFFGIDSGIRHAVTGADYGTVRTAAFMGYRIIAALVGLHVERDGDRVRIHDDAWCGYLANIPPAHFVEHLLPHLPERLLGADFLTLYHGITDAATRVNPLVEYPVRVATAHPIHENTRVERFAVLLSQLGDSPDVAHEMGELMRASHESYSACGLGSEGTDRLVELVNEAGADAGLHGAKITGGGSGGTVAILGRTNSEARVRAIAERYTRESGRFAEVITGTSAGLAY